MYAMESLVSAALLRPLSPPGKPPPVSWKFDVFLTHDWGSDELGRDNHARVSKINYALKQMGFVTWFDEERMRGNINEQMAQGIDRSQAVIVFITKRYIGKVAGHGEKGDDDNW